MKFTYITIFPQLIEAYLNTSILKRAREASKAEYKVIDIRKFSKDKYKSIDDHPYGGGAGMLMTIEPIYKALQSVLNDNFQNLIDKKLKDTAVILPTPRGMLWTQKNCDSFSKEYEHVIFIVPHFEGVDERVSENLVTHQVSVGEYVLTGGELPVLAITDSIVRLIPGVLGNIESLKDESFSNDSYEYPQYTRPSTFVHNDVDWNVPEILLSGNHAEVEKWKKDNSAKLKNNSNG